MYEEVFLENTHKSRRIYGWTDKFSEMLKSNMIYVGVSKNTGTPKPSILIGFSIINHPFWGTPIFGNTHVYVENSTFKDHLVGKFQTGLPFAARPAASLSRLIGSEPNRVPTTLQWLSDWSGSTLEGSKVDFLRKNTWLFVLDKECRWLWPPFSQRIFLMSDRKEMSLSLYFPRNWHQKK